MNSCLFGAAVDWIQIKWKRDKEEQGENNIFPMIPACQVLYFVYFGRANLIIRPWKKPLLTLPPHLGRKGALIPQWGKISPCHITRHYQDQPFSLEIHLPNSLLSFIHPFILPLHHLLCWLYWAFLVWCYYTGGRSVWLVSWHNQSCEKSAAIRAEPCLFV